MNHTSNVLTRTEVFARLKALFEFDDNGVLPCMAPGMSGPLDIPLGYLDLTNVYLNGKAINAVLMLTWVKEESAHLLSAKFPPGTAVGPAAPDEVLRCALAHYEKAVRDHREMVLARYVPSGHDAPLWLKKRLGMAPYFAPEASAA
jgi:hypothetical protein